MSIQRQKEHAKSCLNSEVKSPQNSHYTQRKRSAATSESRTKTTSKLWKREKAMCSCIKMDVTQKANKGSGDKNIKPKKTPLPPHRLAH